MYKRMTALLGAVIVVLLGLVLHLNFKYRMELLSERELWFVVRDFDKERDLAVHSEPKDAAQYLMGLTTIAPREGTSPNENIFEYARASSVREIMAYLRTKTGEDLGDDPQKWIEKYAK